MSDGSEKKADWRKPLLPVSAVALVAGLCGWWFTRSPDRVREPVVENPTPVEVEQRAATPPPPAVATKPLASERYPEPPVGELPIHPVGSADETEVPLLHPHPITPEHRRIFRENALIGQLNDAMDVKDTKAMRELLATYRAEYPDDEMVMQQGYQLILDCLESPGAATRAAAKKYYDTVIASGLRRYIRRHCLEN